MKLQQVAATLRRLAPILEAGSDGSQAFIIRRFGDALDRAGPYTLTAIAKKLDKRLGSFPNVKSVVAEFVAGMSEAFQAAGASSQAKDFVVVAQMLRRLGGLTADEVFDQLMATMAPPAKEPKPPKPSKVTEVNVRPLADKLTAASPNNETFDALVVDVEKLPKPVLTAVANHYLGQTRAYKSKGDIIKAIKARQLQDAIESSRERRIFKIGA